MKKTSIIFLITLFTLTSCKSIISSYLISRGDIKKDYKVLKNEKTGQTIVFLPMIHIGTKQYFNQARKIIDSLRDEKFKFYYENIKIDSDLDSLEKDIYRKKTRSIIGFNPLLQSENNSLPKSYKKKKYILQDYKLMGLNKKDTKLDMSQNQIIDSIEAKYGKLKLTECDHNTGNFEKYNCKTNNDKFAFALTNEFRDPFISNQILDLKEEKIVMIYGRMHWYMVYPDLKKAGFDIVEGKI